jgi:Domain of unknown function (DUF222)/HNH endonuclease
MGSGIEELVVAIEALADVHDPDDVARLLAARDRLDARVCAAVARLDASGAAVVDGAVSTAHWLRTRGGRSSRDAAVLAGRAARLPGCPALAAAWADGRLGGGQVDAVFANVTGRRHAVFADHEAAVLASLVGLSVRHTELAMSHWAALADALVDASAPDPADRAVYLSAGHDGWGELSGRLDPAGSQVVGAALAAASSPDTDGEPARTPAQRRADALVAVARHYLDHADDAATTRGSRPDVHVVVTLADLDARTGCTLDGDRLDAATVGSLLCDAGVHRLVTDGASVALDAGRTTRTVGHHLFSALAVRDGGCRFPACDLPVSRCEAHHVVPWQHGGPTDQSNLVLLCWRHHHDFAHHPQWHLKLLPDATVEVTKPDGRVLASEPRPPPVAVPEPRPKPLWASGGTDNGAF